MSSLKSLTRNHLIEWFQKGEKPPQDWRIGSEHERFLFTDHDLRPLAYDGKRGIKTLMEEFSREGWNSVFEADNLIALKNDKKASITLEPGGQFELSGAPLVNLHQTCDEITSFDLQLKKLCRSIDAASLMYGFLPSWSYQDVPHMPKRRYAIMRDMMRRTGTLGLDMMHRTTTVQVNLDYCDQEDMVAKIRLATALQPLSVALFANSPFKEGKVSGFLSWRSHCWSDTDPARCGLPLFVFDKDFSYEKWVDYLMGVPVYFIRRGDNYLPVKDHNFADLMSGDAPMPEGETLTLQDFEDHAGSVFPEVRLKQFIEMRGSDGTPRDFLCALPAFWVGLLYHVDAIKACEEIWGKWDKEQIATLQHDAARIGLKAKIGSLSLHQLAGEVLSIARAGLKARGHLNSEGGDESIFLSPLLEIAESGFTLAEKSLEMFSQTGSVDFLYREALEEKEE